MSRYLQGFQKLIENRNRNWKQEWLRHLSTTTSNEMFDSRCFHFFLGFSNCRCQNLLHAWHVPLLPLWFTSQVSVAGRRCNVAALLLFIWRHKFLQGNLSDQLIEYKLRWYRTNKYREEGKHDSYSHITNSSVHNKCAYPTHYKTQFIFFISKVPRDKGLFSCRVLFCFNFDLVKDFHS